MKLGRHLVVCVVVGFLLHGMGVARASAAESAAAKIGALNVEAMAAYKAGEPEMAKAKLLEAVVKGKSGGIASQAAMARTYMNLGVVHTDGLKDPEKGARYFGLALKLRPDIKVDADQDSKTVAAAIEKAKAANAASAAATNEVAETAKNDLAAVERSIGKAPPAGKKTPPPAAEATPPPEPEAKVEAKTEAPKPEAKPAAPAPEAKPAPAKVAEAKPAPAPPAAAAGPDLEKEKLKKDKAELEKQLAAARDGEKKEREAKEKLAQEKAELEKQLAPLRDARDKAEKEKQVALAKEQEKKAQEEKAKQEKARLVDGPDMPSELPQALFCADVDERPTGSDLYIHCAAQPKLGAKRYAFHYRTAGAADYSTATMESTKKGWFMTMIPAAKVTGKTLQYYVEAHAADGKVTASNGKAKSPSIMILLPAGSKPKPAAAAAAAATEEAASPEPAEEAAPAKAKAKAKPKRKVRTRASRRAPAKNG